MNNPQRGEPTKRPVRAPGQSAVKRAQPPADEDRRQAQLRSDVLQSFARRSLAATARRASGSARELVRARHAFLLGVLFGAQCELGKSLAGSTPGSNDADMGEYLMGFEAGIALAAPLLNEHGPAIRKWLKRASGQRGGRA